MYFYLINSIQNNFRICPVFYDLACLISCKSPVFVQCVTHCASKRYCVKSEFQNPILVVSTIQPQYNRNSSRLLPDKYKYSTQNY